MGRNVKPKEKGGPWVGLCAAVFYPATGLAARTEVTGAENIPRRGPALLVCNHVSHLDPVFDAVTVHRSGRVPRFLAKDGLFRTRGVGSVMRGAGQIPVYRGSATAQESLREAQNALREGKALAIYPEGTITRDPQGWPMQSRVGVARLALDNDVPIIPYTRWGTQEIYDHYQRKLRLKPRKIVHVRIGEPIDLSAYREQERDITLLRHVTDLLMGRVREQLGTIRGETPPSTFYSPARAKKKGADAGE